MLTGALGGFELLTRSLSNEVDFLFLFIMFLWPCFWSQMDVSRLCGDLLVTDLLTANGEKN